MTEIATPLSFLEEARLKIRKIILERRREQFAMQAAARLAQREEALKARQRRGGMIGVIRDIVTEGITP